MKKYIITLILAILVIIILYFNNIKAQKIIINYGKTTIEQTNEYLNFDISSQFLLEPKLITIYNNCIKEQKNYYDYKICDNIKYIINSLQSNETLETKYGKIQNYKTELEKLTQ